MRIQSAFDTLHLAYFQLGKFDRQYANCFMLGNNNIIFLGTRNLFCKPSKGETPDGQATEGGLSNLSLEGFRQKIMRLPGDQEKRDSLLSKRAICPINGGRWWLETIG